jgi:hypothetical protein
VSSGPRRQVALTQLIDIPSECPELLGQVPEPRIDFVFQGHQKRDSVINEYTFRRVDSNYA